jgi:uncharacterized protein with FMN-binding domain
MAGHGKRRGFKVFFIVLACILGVIIVGGGIAMLVMEPGRREAESLVIENVDFDRLRDGVYKGEYVGTKDHLRDTKVQVTVQAGQLKKIDVTGGALAQKQAQEIRGGQTLQSLFDRVIQKQTLQVDAISGATITCKTHLKAVENALEQAEK